VREKKKAPENNFVFVFLIWGERFVVGSLFSQRAAGGGKELSCFS
jgi:hypothetical protein